VDPMHDPRVRVSLQQAFAILEGWQHLVRIELHPHSYDGKIVGLSQETGTLEFSTVLAGEGKKTLLFELADADFERFGDPGEWEDVFVVFPRTHDWFTLRKWKR
jgi:hypothetical protein